MDQSPNPISPTLIVEDVEKQGELYETLMIRVTLESLHKTDGIVSRKYYRPGIFLEIR